MNELLKSFILILLIIYVVIVALNPSIKNPYFIIFVYENPIILLFLVLLSYYIAQWDLKIGLLLLICVIAVYLDILLIKKGLNKQIDTNLKDDRAFISYVDSFNTHWKQIFNIGIN